MEFVKKHPYLMLFAVILVACILLRVPFGVILLICLGYGVLVYILNIGSAVGWTAYLLDGFLKHPRFVQPMYRFAVNHNTNCAHAQVTYAMDLLRSGSYREARDLFLDVIGNENANALVKKYAENDLGIAYWKCGELDKAIDLMKSMEARYEYFSADFYTTFGYYYIEAGDFEKARECTEKSLKLDPAHGPAYDNLGQIAYREGNLEDAEMHFRHAMELKDTMVDSKYHLGLIYEAWGEYELAAEYFQLAHKCDITAINTLSREQVDAKYEEYLPYLESSGAGASAKPEYDDGDAAVSSKDEDDTAIEAEGDDELVNLPQK